MSKQKITTEIDQIIIGVEVQEAVDLTVAYIRRTQQFTSDEAAHKYWTGLSDDEKISVLLKALVR